MSILSNAVFATSTLLKSLPNRPSRSQLFELYAAYLGFDSYAALNAANLYAALQPHLQAVPALARAKLRQRLKKLELPDSLLVPLEHSIAQQLQLLLPEYPNLVFKDAARYLRLLESDIKFSFNQVSSLNQQLQTMASLGDTDARLFCALWQTFAPDDNGEFNDGLHAYEDDEDEVEGSEYWYRQRLSGSTLSAAANQRADAYEKALVAEQIHSYLPEVYSLNSLAAPNIQAVMHGTEKPNFCCSLPAYEISERLQRIYPPSPEYLALLPWYSLAAIQQPGYGQLQKLFEEFEEPEERHAVYLFGLANNVDISQGKNWLINSYTGKEWDEDGPAELAGFDGVQLSKLTDLQQQKAQSMAERLAQLVMF